ncbi:head-tail joining protein [Photobacterium sp. OFAV2-7]|uniref:head-tail joining protein n=1 Tax=Photobacterium sp. OFAV2-7 TaxID=2917748 RepID=UPI001EF5F106|nr:head-tail joining protein [Photobacterium sp. OFAV2-7]MCG7588391.1 head-tail joining protein [Photobacterium sp. OFAV2-7]
MSVDTVARQANEAIIDAFSNVDVIADGYEPVRGIFTGPSEIAKLDGGGFVDAQRGTLIVKSAEAGHLERRTAITLQFENGTRQSYLVVLPENDGSGRLKLTLGQENVGDTSSNQPESSSISY